MMAVDYQKIGQMMDEFMAPVKKQENSGVYPIVLQSKHVGEIDICYKFETVYASIELVDTFLTIEQMMELMTRLKSEFNLADNQKISITHV